MTEISLKLSSPGRRQVCRDLGWSALGVVSPVTKANRSSSATARAGSAALQACVHRALQLRTQARPTSCRGRRPVEAQSRQIQLVNERIDNTHRVVFPDEIVKALR